MPRGASAAGEAFELLSSRYLGELDGLKHTAAPFYTRLPRGKWVQFDGLFSRDDGSCLVLEAKFYNAPIGLGTPGIAPRISFAKELSATGIVLASRCGFSRDVMRLRLPIQKILLSWPGMQKGLSKKAPGLLSACLDELTPCNGGLMAASGAHLDGAGMGDLAVSADGLTFATPLLERWARRLAASPADIDLSAPRRVVRCEGTLSVEEAWAIEDSLRGFAPASPKLLADLIEVLEGGALEVDRVRRRMWRRGYRGRRGGIQDALRDLCVIGAAERFRSARGVFYGPRPGKGGGEGKLLRALERWPAYAYFRKKASGALEKYETAAKLSAAFARFYPYARSLYNPAKVSGLIALCRHFHGADSTVRPS